MASSSEEEHAQHLRTLLGRLSECGIIININKCVFGQPEVRFLGYLINKDGTKPLDSKVESIKNFKQPETVDQLKRFSGMLNYYRSFLPMAAATQAPLFECTKGNKKKDKTVIEWTPERIEAFQKCKEQLANATLLSHPSAAIGVVVNQFKDNCWQPLAFFSKRLITAQSKYSTYDRELVAMYASIKHFKSILEAREFTIFTDHKPLVFACNQKNEKASPRQLRHLDFIGQFSTDIRHISGVDNVVADTLSRINNISAISLSSSVEYKLIARQQQDDKELQQLKKRKSGIKLLQVEHDGVILTCDVSGEKLRPFIPLTLRKNIFEQVHNLSHAGAKATTKLFKRSFVWPSLNKDVQVFCKSCLPCQRTKIQKHNRTAFQSINMPSERFSHVHIDLVGPLPSSEVFSIGFLVSVYLFV